MEISPLKVGSGAAVVVEEEAMADEEEVEKEEAMSEGEAMPEEAAVEDDAIAEAMSEQAVEEEAAMPEEAIAEAMSEEEALQEEHDEVTAAEPELPQAADSMAESEPTQVVQDTDVQLVAAAATVEDSEATEAAAAAAAMEEVRVMDLNAHASSPSVRARTPHARFDLCEVSSSRLNSLPRFDCCILNCIGDGQHNS